MRLDFEKHRTPQLIESAGFFFAESFMMPLKPAPRLYGRRWREARAAFLAKHPLCTLCEKIGRVTAASVVDHIQPHKGNAKRFWDRNNWQPLCKRCHDAVKQSEERTGSLRGAAMDGQPLDPNHHWNVLQ